MTTALLFLATVVIWGTTWIAIAAQVGQTPVMVSVFLRFALAGPLMLAGLALLGRLRRPVCWRFVIIQALCLFSFNFIGLYNATRFIPSGLVSVVFSLASIFNALNARIFFGDKVNARTVLAGAVGVSGLVLIFWTDIFTGAGAATLKGVGWALMGTLMFSLGTMASRRNNELGVNALTANSWGMGAGALVLLGLVVLSGQPIRPPAEPVYWGALIYLALIGSVAGFTAYLVLAARIGAVRAGYATVVFPVIALAVSTIAEGYHWTPLAMTGAAMTIAGNLIMFWPRPAPGSRPAMPD